MPVIEGTLILCTSKKYEQLLYNTVFCYLECLRFTQSKSF